MFKRLVTTITVLTLLFSAILPVQLFADDDLGYEGQVCRDLGILKGNTGVVDNAYLETRPSRLQSAIMFLRLKGLENDALSYTGGNNFKDAGAVAWKEGRNVLSYLKDHPELGWIGDGVNFLPYNPIDSKAYYKVLLESLGYKQKIDGDGDFAWSSVLDFAAEKGLSKVADAKIFTVRSLAAATVEALQTKMKNSNRKLIEYLVDIGDVDSWDAISLGLYSRDLEADVKAVKAISNSKVEIIFEEAVDASEAADEDLYTIKNLSIKGVSVKNASAVIVDTSAMSESTTYALVFNDKSYSFKGLKKDAYAPKLIIAECKDTDLVELSFDRVLDNKAAQDTDTYSIAGVAVKSAELDSTNTKVRIVTSGIQTGRSYELKVHNIKNGDGVTTKLITKRFTGKKDTIPPKLNKLTVLNNVKLLLEFADSNGLNKALAEKEENYRITSGSGDLEVVSAKVKDKDEDGLWDSVELVTESQTAGRSYTLRIENIADNSVLGNSITKEIKKDFRGKAADKSAPTVDRNPKAITSNIVEIVFKDANALDVESACDPDNYEIDDGLDIREIKIKSPSDLYSQGGKTVHIVTSEMDKSKTYTLIIKEIADEFGNELKASSGSGYKKYRFRGMAEDNTPPYVTFVECIDSKTVEIKFDNLLDKDSAENIANYRIDGLALVTKAKLQEDEKTVRLTVSSLSSDKNHTILMSSIKDISGNSLSNISVSVVYNGNLNDTDAPEVEYIEAMNEYEIRVHFDEEVNAHSAQLKASGITFKQVGSVLDNGTAVVMKASSGMKDKEYEVTSLTGVWDLRNNAYKFEDNLEFYGTDVENDPPEVDDWEQMDVTRFRVIFTEPVLLIGNGVSGIKNPSGVSLNWSAKLNPEEEDNNEAYSTVDFIASKEIPVNKEYRFNFTAMISDYMGKGVYDEEDDDGSSKSTVLESYMEDDEDPYIEYEAITRTKAQVVFNEAIKQDKPGTYKITYRDDNDKLKTIRISRVEVDSKDKNRVNILTEDKMSQEYVYTLIPVTAAADIAGNRLDIDDVEMDFEGSNVMSSDYIQGVEFQNAYSFKVTKSSKIYNNVTSFYELDTDGDTIGGNLTDGSSVRVSDNVHRVTSKKPLLRDVRYRITVDGLEYRFYGGVQNGDIELELPEREIIFYDMDVKEYDVKAYRSDGDELDVYEERGNFFIKASERLRNGEWIYIYVIRESDDAIIYGTRVKIEGMPTASSSKEITSFSFKNLDPDVVGSIDGEDNIIKLSVPYGTDVDNLTASFKCSEDALVKVGSTVQVSGETKNDFSKEVTYTVIAQDGSEAYYKVVVAVEESKLEKKIASFVLKDLKPEVAGIIDDENHVITLELPNGTELEALKPTIDISPETTVSPKSEIENDFSQPAIYKVTAKDGSVQNYTVKASVHLSSENSIKFFKFEGVYAYETIIIGGNENTISIEVPYNTNVTELIPIITVSEDAKITPKSGEVNDFSNEVNYKVIAQNGSERNYTVKVTIAKEMDKSISSFRFEKLKSAASGQIDEKNRTITITVPYGTNVTKLVPAITIPDKTEITPKSGQTQNFSEPVVYTVTAYDGTTREYTVYVKKTLNSAKSITSFSFPEFDPPAEGSISDKSKTIAVTVPYGTNVTSLKASFTTSPEAIVKIGKVTQVSGETENDFTKPVTYTVAAQDGSVRDYTVTVTVALSNEKLMKEFGFAVPKAAGIIDEDSRNISIKVPYNTELNGLKAVFGSSDNSIVRIGEVEQKSGETANDFRNSVTYIVVAQDGSIRDYNVTVAPAAVDEKKMAGFNLKVGSTIVKGVIDEASRTIRLIVPKGTSVESLIAAFIYTGKSIAVDGTPQISEETVNDFSRNVVYTITAYDDTTLEYTVTVTVSEEGE